MVVLLQEIIDLNLTASSKEYFDHLVGVVGVSNHPLKAM